MNLRMKRRLKTYTNVSDEAIARTIGAEHGIKVEAKAKGPVYDVVQQWNMSDLAFLRERARALQAEIWIERDTLYFKTRDQRTGTTLTLRHPDDLLELRARADLAHQRTSVTVSGYDARGRTGISKQAGTDAVAAEITTGRSGLEILAQAFGKRESYRVRQAPLESGEAEAWVRAEMLRRARSFVKVCGCAYGQPDMVVGSRLTLENCGTPFDGPDYYSTRVCHTYDMTNGHRTHFEAERATIQEGA